MANPCSISVNLPVKKYWNLSNFDDMRRFALIILLLSAISLTSCMTRRVVQGPQGKIATTMRIPHRVDSSKDSIDVVLLMHGIFSSKSYAPIPKIARSIQKHGVAALSMDFGGHGRSQGKKVRMTIDKEIEEAKVVYDYVCSLPNVRNVYLLRHSQGGVVASMLAGELAKEGRAPAKLILLAPGSVIKDACRVGHFFGTKFDPRNPPEFIRCFGIFKLGRDYLTQTQQLNIYGTAANYQGPVCLIHGTKDKIVSVRCSRKYDDIYRNSQLHLIEGETHTMRKKIDETTDIINRFLDE